MQSMGTLMALSPGALMAPARRLCLLVRLLRAPCPLLHPSRRCVAFELFAQRQLLPVSHSLAEYESRVHSLTLVDMTGAALA